MADESVEVLVVGAGQAGVAMSEHLSRGDVPHLVLERDRIAERWRTGRWDSLVANGPAWHDRFPGLEFADVHPDAFASKDQVAAYFEAYAEKFAAPIRCGVEVTSVRRNAGRPGFRAETSDGVIDARYVVAATGPFQRPVIPAVVPDDAPQMQIHSSGYRNPEQLPDGAVLVVGAGSSGMQIADELLRAGRRVFLSVGPHDRPPRAYRGRDFCWWLGVLGKWDAETPPSGAEHVTIVVSGADGGHTVDFRDLAARGMTLLGRTLSHSGGTLHLAPDLGVNIAKGDANYLSLLNEADVYVEQNGLDLPEEPEAHRLGPLPDSANDPILGARPGRRRRELDHLGDGLPRRLQLAAGRHLRRAGPADPQARCGGRAGRVLPRAAVAVAARVELHLGRLARRQAPGRPHRDPARLPGVPGCIPDSVPRPEPTRSPDSVAGRSGAGSSTRG